MTQSEKQQATNFLRAKYSEGQFRDKTEFRKEVQRSLGVKETRAREITNQIIEAIGDKFTKVKTKQSVNKETKGQTQELNVTTSVSSLEDVIKVCNIDTTKWNIEKYSIEQGAPDKAGNAQFRWKLAMEKKVGDDYIKIINDLKDDLKKNSKIVPHKNYGENNGFMLEISIFDLHLGKKGWSAECNSNYDIKIAKDIYFDALFDLTSKGLKFGIPEKIVFVVGQDFINIDNNLLTTTAGTKQDVDGRFSKIYKEGRQILTDAIDYLKDIAPVEVIVISGNHDTNVMFHIGDALECYYHNDKNVNINNNPISRKYFKYGNTLIVYDHGDKIKADQFPLIMATECKEDWSATKYRECHLAHVHHEVTKEVKGCKIRYLSSLSGSDLYHFDNGYIGSLRQAEGFIFDKDEGLVSTIYSKPVET